MISLSGTIDHRCEGRLTCTSPITSPTRANTAERYSGSVTTDVELPRVSYRNRTEAGDGKLGNVRGIEVTSP